MVLNPLRVKICYKKMGIFQQNARAREEGSKTLYFYSFTPPHKIALKQSSYSGSLPRT